MKQGNITNLEKSMGNLSVQEQENTKYTGEGEITFFEFENNDKTIFFEMIEQNFSDAIQHLSKNKAHQNLQITLQQYQTNNPLAVIKDETDSTQFSTILENLIDLSNDIHDAPSEIFFSEETTPCTMLAKHLFLLCSILRYNILVTVYLSQRDYFIQVEQFNQAMNNVLNEFATLRHFIDKKEDPNSFTSNIMRKILKKMMIATPVFEPNWMGVKELEYHIRRKNKTSLLNKTHFHAECIYNPNSFTTALIDSKCITGLISKMDRIRLGQQSRTQFIVYPDGLHHALVVDVAWNKTQNRFEIICIESTNINIQHMFLVAFESALIQNIRQHIRTYLETLKYKIIGIQADLQKNESSCVTFALALSREVSKTSFAELEKMQSITQPLFLMPNGLEPLQNLNITWLPVTALGLKAVLMGQSFTDMQKNLTTFYPKKPQEVKRLINMVKQRYQLNGDHFNSVDDKDHAKSYIHHRREALRKQTQVNPVSDLSIELICKKSGATSHDHALRICAKEGPAREFKFLLDNLPKEDIHKIGLESKRNALHFAYIGNKPARAQLLIDKKADQNAIDNYGKIPRDYYKELK